MTKYIFNIGSAVNGVDKTLSEIDVLYELQQANFYDAEIIRTVQSDTETTYVVVCDGFYNWFGTPHTVAVHALAQKLRQDAIAYKVGNTGFLVGPKAEDWGGEFKQEYFID